MHYEAIIVMLKTGYSHIDPSARRHRSTIVSYVLLPKPGLDYNVWNFYLKTTDRTVIYGISTVYYQLSDNPPSPCPNVASLVIRKTKQLKLIKKKDLCLRIPRICD